MMSTTSTVICTICSMRFSIDAFLARLIRAVKPSHGKIPA
jgi:hypothetical protein